MSPDLAAAIERARNHKMTPQERLEQRVSFVYGQQDWSSGHARTKDEVREHLASIYGYPAQGMEARKGGDAPKCSFCDDSGMVSAGIDRAAECPACGAAPSSDDSPVGETDAP